MSETIPPPPIPLHIAASRRSSDERNRINRERISRLSRGVIDRNLSANEQRRLGVRRERRKRDPNQIDESVLWLFPLLSAVLFVVTLALIPFLKESVSDSAKAALTFFAVVLDITIVIPIAFVLYKRNVDTFGHTRRRP